MTKDITARQSNITERDRVTFDLATKVAKLSGARYMHGAVIRKGKSIVSVACNKLTTHPVQRRYGKHVCSLHAEIRAVILAKGDVVGCDCYSARVRGDGKYAISRPCATCWALLAEAGIRDIIYFNGDSIVKERIL